MKVVRYKLIRIVTLGLGAILALWLASYFTLRIVFPLRLSANPVKPGFDDMPRNTKVIVTSIQSSGVLLTASVPDALDGIPNELRETGDRIFGLPAHCDMWVTGFRHRMSDPTSRLTSDKKLTEPLPRIYEDARRKKRLGSRGTADD
jgi:hypothetical protein